MFCRMNSRKWLGNAMSPELPEASKYRAFLRELQIRTSDLWDSMLCLGPNLNANELMKEHLALREYLVEIETMQKSFARTADINLTLGFICIASRFYTLMSYCGFFFGKGERPDSVVVWFVDPIP